MTIREVEPKDLANLLALYTHLKNHEVPEIDQKITDLWDEILQDRKIHLLVGEIADVLVTSCILIVIPNLSNRQTPYALIENVVTHPDYRGKGYATQVLNHARDIAVRHGCYKLMLMTGSKKESTLRFYERAGFNRTDKTAFVQWLDGRNG